MKAFMKKLLSVALCLVIVAGLAPATRTEAKAATRSDIDSEELLGDKQTSNSDLCVVYASMYMARRRIAIEDSVTAAKQITLSHFQPSATGSTSSPSVYSSFNYTAPDGIKHSFKRINLYSGGSSGATTIASLADSDTGIKAITGGNNIAKYTDGTTDPDLLAKVLKYLLDIHPEGIVVWAYNGNAKHAVLVTSCDSGGNFSCADSVSSAKKTPVLLTDSYLYNKSYTNYAKTQNDILKYICAFWYITDINTSKGLTDDHPTPPPAAPTDLTGKRSGTANVQLNWTAVSGATSYEAQYSRPGVGWTTLDESPTSKNTLLAKGFSWNYDYVDFRVRAVNTGGASGWTQVRVQKEAVESPTPSTPSGQTSTLSEFQPIWPIENDSRKRITTLDYYLNDSQNGYGSLHKGIDIVADIDKSIVKAVADGTVIHIDNTCTHNYGKNDYKWDTCGQGCGNYIVIEHSIGNECYYSVYMHLTKDSYSDYGIYEGATVHQGDQIARSGSTGWSTDGHLHLELMKGDLRNFTTSKLHTLRESVGAQSFQYYLNNLSVLDGVTIWDAKVKYSKYFATEIPQKAALVKIGSDNFYKFGSSSTVNPPAAPTDLTGKRSGTADVQLNWTAVTGATSYEAQYSRPGVGWTALDESPTSANSLLAKGFSWNYEYVDFRIRAVNAAGASEWAEVRVQKTCDRDHSAVRQADGSYTYKTVQKADGTYTAVCKICGAEYVLPALDTGEAGTYTVVLEGAELCTAPYQDANIACPLKDAELTIIGSVVNAYGNKWYQLQNGQWIWEGHVQKKTSPGKAKEVHFSVTKYYTQGQFADVPTDQWYTVSVENAYSFGLMRGNSDVTFNPYGNVTIAEAITMAARIHSIFTTGSEDFNQSSGQHWYDTYKDYAYANGIIGASYYDCDVTQSATRAQFAEIFARSLPAEALAAINDLADGVIPDVAMSANYAVLVYLLYRAGILTGSDSNGTFYPQSFITRAEAAAIVSRMAESGNRVWFAL